MKRVVIVGGGISGLAAAFYLRRARPDLAILLLEARDRMGGVISTQRRDGFVVEGGPDSFLIQKPWALQLCLDLGISERLIAANAANRKIYVVSGGRLRPLPPEMMMGAPTKPGLLLKSDLISWPGKIRMALDLVLPRGPEGQDESLGDFITRRLGREALEKIADPILGGIYLADARRLSLAATFPRLRELERAHRSLILGLRREAKAAGEERSSPFRTFPTGMEELVAALECALAGVELRRGRRVEAVTRSLQVSAGDLRIAGDAVIVAMPPPAAAEILRPNLRDLAEALDTIPSVSSATISLAFRAPRTRLELDASGFVVARGERRRIRACSWSSCKFPLRAPEGSLLVRCFVGGEESEELLARTDEELIGIAREELAELMGLDESPCLASVSRWPKANPILEVGHAEKLSRVESVLDTAPRLFLTGAGYRGVGIPDCVRDARNVVQRVAAVL
ncbi:MAG TPA: protoporphyrinogen oxidase [Candidatus Polarisedimenticolia bacterium]|nr:protoporphyrinogen oxidase [Candidatus Polarisedimenticolia bacterium]